jgi:hypothetical protein
VLPPLLDDADANPREGQYIDRRTLRTSQARQPGTTQADSALFPDTAEIHNFTAYLPPCSTTYTDSSYPTLYWTINYGDFVFITADDLIAQNAISPFIIVMLDIQPTKGLNADARIVDYVIPYIDAHYRTQADPKHRSITGISHGAADSLGHLLAREMEG